MFLRTLTTSLLCFSLLGCQTSPSIELQPDPPITNSQNTVTFNTKPPTTFNVELADTTAERTRGLMFREQIADNYGMYFIFPKQRELSFWMKNTLIPLDIIYIDQNNTVVDISANTPPCEADPCPSYPSSQPAQYVLEINAGLAEELGIKIGQEVEFQE